MYKRKVEYKVKISKKKIRKIYQSLVCIAISICMLLSTGIVTVLSYSDEDVSLGKYNKSDKIYKWTRVRTVDEIMEIFESVDAAKKKDLRMLLIPAVSHGSDEAPTFSNYYILEDDEFNRVSLKQNPWIDINKDVFYSQGGFRTPYIKFEGLKSENKTIDLFCEPVPSVRLYEADKNDKKKDKLLAIGYDIWHAYKQKIINESEIKDYHGHVWEIGFPAAHDDSYLTKKHLKGKEYRKTARELLMVGGYIRYDGGWYGLINDDAWWPGHFYWEMVHAEQDLFIALSETFYMCYIGVEGEGFNSVKGTLTVENGQTVALDGMSQLKSGSSVVVKEGGTLFISGELVNNGVIHCDGGTVVVQKGALVHTYTTSNKLDGRIVVSSGQLIVREGGRVVNFHEKLKEEKSCSFFVENTGYVINRGIIATAGDVKISGKGEFCNEGHLYIGYQYKDAKTILESYSAETTDKSANDYAREVTSAFHNLVKKGNAKKIDLVQVDGNTGVMRNEGSIYYGDGK
jgi:hypothetical protein